jgi:hypothetical protein
MHHVLFPTLERKIQKNMTAWFRESPWTSTLSDVLALSHALALLKTLTFTLSRDGY